MNNPPGEGDDPLRLSQLRRVDALCANFSLLCGGGRTSVEKYLAAKYLEGIGGAQEREEIVRNLLAVEIEQRRKNYERPSPEEYRQRFPGYDVVVDGLFGQPFPGGKAQLPSSADEGGITGGRFRILRLHAEGGLGAVYIAHDAELNREVALKEVKDEHADNVQCRSQFLLEGQVTGSLEHPGIVPVYSLNYHPDSRPYYAMQLIRGESLRARIKTYHEQDRAATRGPGTKNLDLRELLGHLIAACNAVEYAHSKGVLHRDIKPDNIMVGPYGETVVLDWGLAQVRDTSAVLVSSGAYPIEAAAPDTLATVPKDIVGTPAYMSPEQAAGEVGRLTPTTDIYSLGVTLYMILTGRPPFEETDMREILRRVRSGDFASPRELDRSLSEPLQAICLKAMAYLPDERYESARGLANDLEHWLADEPVTAMPETLQTRLVRLYRKKPLVTAVFVGCAIIDVIFIGIRSHPRWRNIGVLESTWQSASFAMTLLSNDLCYAQFGAVAGAGIGALVGLAWGMLQRKGKQSLSQYVIHSIKAGAKHGCALCILVGLTWSTLVATLYAEQTSQVPEGWIAVAGPPMLAGYFGVAGAMVGTVVGAVRRDLGTRVISTAYAFATFGFFFSILFLVVPQCCLEFRSYTTAHVLLHLVFGIALLKCARLRETYPTQVMRRVSARRSGWLPTLLVLALCLGTVLYEMVIYGWAEERHIGVERDSAFFILALLELLGAMMGFLAGAALDVFRGDAVARMGKFTVRGVITGAMVMPLLAIIHLTYWIFIIIANSLRY
jgi:serine/threonine protein kinase